MRTIYKEEYCRKKLPTVIGMFLLLTIIILIYDAIRANIVSSKTAVIITTFLLYIVLATSVTIATLRCRLRFRCSLIADQFIVYKMSKQEQRVEHNIKVKDIVCIKKISMLECIVNRVKHSSYLSSTFDGRIYCCIYKDGDRHKKFFFQPSCILISKLNDTISDECKCKVS